MLVTLWWWLFSLCWWFSQCIKSVINIPNLSPTSQTCHQHIWFPITVTYIDVTWWFKYFFTELNQSSTWYLQLSNMDQQTIRRSELVQEFQILLVLLRSRLDRRAPTGLITWIPELNLVTKRFRHTDSVTNIDVTCSLSEKIKTQQNWNEYHLKF